ncbi:MAG: tryptophan 7-halogenase [Gammaproteobacteria bacterium]|nr:tryptophan 7-halogenase [Gammaproteobacteria bacterium]
MKDNQKIKDIIIIGGGSAGWMSASYIAQALNFDVNITVIESETIGRIGVGEATVPTIKTEFFDRLGLAESDWMPHCNATYKMGVKFSNWRKPIEEGGDYYYHNFGEIPSYDDVPLTHVWIKKYLEEDYKVPMDYACFSSLLACDENKSPNLMDGTKVQHYAYHFDALLLANFLKGWSTKRGVKHIIDDLVTAELDEQGNIKCVVGKTGKKYAADLFIDCSGFAGFLIEKILKEPIVSFEESLLTDRAVALNIPETPEINGIRPYTTSQAMKAGWMWQIPLYNRSGNGYVYSSQFMTEEEAEREIRQYFGKRADNVTARFVKFQSRRRRRSWVANCVSIGLASGFLEPLESTGIYFIYAALFQLIKNFPNKIIEPVLRDKFNKKVAYMVEDVKDFIVMHFKTAVREDTPFWKGNKYDTKTPESLQLILDRQKAGLPIRKSHQGDNQLYSSFAARFENFWTNSSYQCIFAGVGLLPNHSLPLLNYRKDIMDKGNADLAKIAQDSKKLSKILPTQYEYLRQLYSAGGRSQ